jgi:hypothetical protein
VGFPDSRAEPSRDLGHGSAKINVVDEHYKVNYIAVRTAAETMKEPFVVGDGEGRRPFAVERA